MLNLETYNEEERGIVFGIGYHSNDANYVLSKLMRKSNEKIGENDIKSLKDMSNLLNDAEKGKKVLESFEDAFEDETVESLRFNGYDASNVSIYTQFVKLMLNPWDKQLIFKDKSFQEIKFQKIKEDIIKNKKNLEDLISYSTRNEAQLSTEIKEKIGQVKGFLSKLSWAYQCVFSSSMNF